jgi:thiol-disulfide isomerase/thioredoxin
VVTRLRRHLLRAVAPSLALGLVVGACSGGDSAPAGSATAECRPEKGIVSVGEQIPAACSFERLDGGTLRLADLGGKPTLINFWASWCTFCIEEMPAFQKVYAAVSSRMEFVGADLLDVQGETRGAAEQFGASTGVRYPLIYDKGGLLYGHFSAQLLMPVTIFIRSNGIVAHRRFGPMDESMLRSLLREHLGVV